MSNHLIIGLGGTGGKIIRNIRKAIYRDWRPTGNAASTEDHTLDQVERATPTGVRIDYLYVDSSREHMKDDDPDWKILGENLQLTPSSQCHLKGSDLPTILQDVHARPELAPWIGRPQDWGGILNLGAGSAEVLGGQKRRLGRLLFASNASNFMGKVNKKVNNLRTGTTDGEVTFHVVCGLAGGTGSGSLIDAICLLRNEYADTKNYSIILYLLLPDEYPPENWNTGNYHANGFAALTELNALGVGQYLPFNILSQGERYESLSSPFKVCYLVTNENSTGAPFDVDNEVPELMAEMLYQTIVADRHGGARQIDRIQAWENMEISHEGKTADGSPARCRLFASFGIKKISYPEDIIRDYIGYSLSAQTLLQMLYNNWAQQYLAQPEEVAVEGLVADTATQTTFNLDKEVFFLERQFSTDDFEKDQKDWKKHDVSWRAYIERLAQDLGEQEGNALTILKNRCEEREKQSFRDGRGIVDYFSWKTDRIPEYASFIAGNIEEALAEDLMEGKRSLQEIQSILKALGSLIDRNLEQWEAEKETVSAEAAKERMNWTENIKRLEDMGPLARMIPGSREKIFEAGRDGMIRYFSKKTRVAAWDFAQSLIRVVKSELEKTRDHVVTTIGEFENAYRGCTEKASEHRPEQAKSTDVVMRLFNGDEVTRYVEALIGNQDFQLRQARQARANMMDKMMSGRTSLRALPAAGSDLLDILARSSHATLATFDATAEREGGFAKLLSVSIIDKLRERYQGDTDRMKKEIRDYIKKAGHLLKINDAEHGKKGPGTDFAEQNKKSNIIILMPISEPEDEFARELKKAFSSLHSASTSVDFVNTREARRHEITILSFVSLFPLRYVDLLGKLRAKYQGRLKEGDAAQRLLEIHTEGDASTLPGQFPSLYVPPVRDVVGPSLLLGLACGSVRPKSKGGETASITDELVLLDEDDSPTQELGAGFLGALQRCAPREIHERLERANQDRIAPLSKQKEKLGELKASLRPLAKQIADGNDEELRAMINHAKEAEKVMDALASRKK